MLAFTATAFAASRLTFEDTLARNQSSSVTVTVHRKPAFRLKLKAPTAGRTRLYLTGRNAPAGGPILDTKTSDCSGAAGTFVCSSSLESLPKGTYKFRIKFTGASGPANVRLTARWYVRGHSSVVHPSASPRTGVYRPAGWRAVKPLPERGSVRQRGPLPPEPEVSSRRPAMTANAWPLWA